MTIFLARDMLPAVLVAASALGCAGSGSVAQTPQQPMSNRGELLYNTHCIACHTTQLHWRDKKQATNWTGIEAQVRRWQGISGLAWSNADITEVSRYLNNTIYKYPQTGEVISLDAVR